MNVKGFSTIGNLHLASVWRSTACVADKLVVPSVKLSTYCSRSFAFCGPTVWNKLPDYLRNPSLCTDIFNRDLKTFLFAHY